MIKIGYTMIMIGSND